MSGSEVVRLSDRGTRPPERPGKKASSSLADTVRDRIVEAIHEGEILPGDRLIEADLAEHHQVSRTPVREAFRRLEVEGWVTQTRYSGVQVVELDRSRTSSLYTFRAVLEGTAARLAAQHADNAEIELMTDIQDELASVDEPRQLARLNRALHDTIFEASRNPYVQNAQANLRASIACLRGTTLAVPGRRDEVAAEHGAIIAAIAGHDPDEAERAAVDHIHQARRVRLKLMTGLAR